MINPDFETVRKLARQYSVIPVSMEIHADMETPITLLKRIDGGSKCFLLESVEGGEKWGRYSIVGRNPFLTLRTEGGKTIIDEKGKTPDVRSGSPVDMLKECMERYKSPEVPGLPRFAGGAAGYFGYDTVRYTEHLPDVPQDDVQLPDCCFMIVDEVLVYDHLRQKIHIITNIRNAGNIERAYASAVARLKEMHAELKATRWKLSNPPAARRGSGLTQDSRVETTLDLEQYCQRVEKAKQYIKNGDIFQVVLSQRMGLRTDVDALNVYRALRVINPSLYMYYFNFGSFEIAGSSPEMLLRVESGVAETCPIAGTRRRGATPEEDLKLESELLADGKELSEHTMLVDLGRNDLGRVCSFGTVEVRNAMHVERYSHVMHLVTNLNGKLAEGKSAFDALTAVLPAGTLSGAPKVRAMQIIDELEPRKRGVYGGATGYLSFSGNLDSCITIRTVVFKDGKAYVQAGAGIVADSVPENEYGECMNKAGALLKAIREAGEIA